MKVQYYERVMLLSLWLGTVMISVVSFSPQSTYGRRQRTVGSVVWMSKKDNTTVEKKGKTTLTFHAEKSLESDPTSLPSSSSLDDFFETNKLMVLRGESNEVEEASPEKYTLYYDTWVARCQEEGFAAPSLEKKKDTIYKVINSGTDFPGLKIRSRIHMGCKLIPSSESASGYPEIENVMLDTQDFAEGPRFLVWLYKKLTGNTDDKKEEEEEKGQESTTACSKFYVTPSSSSDNNNNNNITFHSSTKLDIRVEFPSLLLKLMPMSKEKSEEAGSQSIAKVIEKDNGATLALWTNTYNSWLESTMME